MASGFLDLSDSSNKNNAGFWIPESKISRIVLSPLKIFHLSIHWEGMDIFWSDTFQNSDSLTWGANQAINMQSLLTKRKVEIVVYSYFEKGCRKKYTRQSRKALWMVLSSLFVRQI